MSTPTPSRQGLRTALVDLEHPARSRVERFISDRFLASHNSRISNLMSHHVVCRNDRGDILAAVGFRVADGNTLFLESYLEQPIEQVIAAQDASQPTRPTIAEVGNLASINHRATLLVFRQLFAELDQRQIDWVVCTACDALQKSMARQGLVFDKVCTAHASCLGAQAAHWGSYFAAQPNVLVGDLNAARVSFAHRNGGRS